MKIAVTYEDGMVFQHFGQSKSFKLYDAEAGQIICSEVVGAEGKGHGALAAFLKKTGADAVICGGIGMGARMALQEAGIQLYGGVTGSADEAAEALAENRLVYDPEARCDHHHDHGVSVHHCGGACSDHHGA